MDQKLRYLLQIAKKTTKKPKKNLFNVSSGRVYKSPAHLLSLLFAGSSQLEEVRFNNGRPTQTLSELKGYINDQNTIKEDYFEL